MEKATEIVIRLYMRLTTSKVIDAIILNIKVNVKNLYGLSMIDLVTYNTGQKIVKPLLSRQKQRLLVIIKSCRNCPERLFVYLE